MNSHVPTHVTNWEESVSLNPSVVVQPDCVETIVDIVKDHNRYPSPIRAAGSRHTTTRCGVADGGTLLIMTQMNRITEIGDSRVTAEAGALYIDVAQKLRQNGRQFYVNVEIGNLTMGSAACTGTKDASMPGEFGQVSSYVQSMKVVLPSGELREITEDEPELLQAMRSSYGLLGVVYEVTFKIKRLQPMSVYHLSYSLDEFEKQLPALKKKDESMMYYLFPFLNSITVEFRKYAVSKSACNRWVWKLRNYVWKTFAPVYSCLATKFIPLKVFRYFLIDSLYRVIQFLLNTLIKSSHTIAADQIIRYPEKKGISKYTFSIWAFPEDKFIPVLREYYAFCHQYYRDYGYRCDILNVGYRISEDQNPWFSYSYDGTVMTIDPVDTGSKGWDEFLQAYNDFCSERGGVPLFNQSKWLTRDHVQKAFGDRLRVFWTYRTRLDPDNRLLNAYFEERLNPKDP